MINQYSIFDMKSNDRGTYIKFNNGLMLCICNSILTNIANNVGIIWSTHQFPQPFKNPPQCTITNFERVRADQNYYFYWSRTTNISTTEVSFGFLGSGSGIQYSVGCIAFGFWR